MEKQGIKSRLGRFSYLLSGGAKPRRSLAFMTALVIVAMLSMAGTVSADNYWKGSAPQTELSGTVNGGVDVQFADTWKSPDNVVSDSAWANFTLAVDPTNVEMKFAHLYVLVYMGNMTANYKGTEDIQVYPDGANPVVLTDAQPLELEYDRTVGPSYVDVYDYTSYYIWNISRVTSDYQNIFDINDPLTLGRTINVSIVTTNRSDILGNKFDGRIKEAKLVYGWNVSSGSTGDTKYWINEGHDPVTKNLVNPYVTNQTYFNNIGTPSTYTAKLWVDYSATKLGNGTYTWNGVDISKGSAYPPTLTSGTYGGINSWTWTNAAGPGISATGNNILTYSKTNDWYKIPLAVFTIK